MNSTVLWSVFWFVGSSDSKGIGGKLGWAWIFVGSLETREFIDKLRSPGRIVHGLCGSYWVLTYTFNSKTLQVPHF